MSAVTSHGWLLALHLLAAFVLTGSLTMAVVVTVAARRLTMPAPALALGRVDRLAVILVRAGLVLTAVFGVWLVFVVDHYSLLNGWVIAGILLWLAAGALSGRAALEAVRRRRLAAELTAGGEEGRGGALAQALHRRAPLALGLSALLAALVAVAVMIWKPGA